MARLGEPCSTYTAAGFVWYSPPFLRGVSCQAVIPTCHIKGFLIYCSLSSPATSTGRHNMKTQFLKRRGRNNWSSSSSHQKVGTTEGVMVGVFMRERALPHLGSTVPTWLSFLLVHLAFKGKMTYTGKVACALRIRCSKGENLNA